MPAGNQYLAKRQRRQVRELVYRRTIEETENAKQEKRDRVKAALASNTKLPSELEKEGLNLQASAAFDDKGGEGVKSKVDDEYRWMGVQDPDILMTTSRDPSPRLKEFVKELRLTFPNAAQFNRGNHNEKSIVKSCRDHNKTDLIIVHETRGEPDTLIISHLPYGPTAQFNIRDCRRRHDVQDGSLKPMPQQYPHLIFENFNSALGKRVKTILQALFPVLTKDSNRVITFANKDDNISFRHHSFKRTDHKNVEMNEVGPRFELKLFRIDCGTIDEVGSVENEYQTSAFTRTATKRRFL